jgi:hypothetical protein
MGAHVAGGPGRSSKRVVAITVDDRRGLALVRGWDAKELVEAAGHRPLWSGSGRGWVVDARHVPDVEALAQHEHRILTVRQVGGGPA